MRRRPNEWPAARPHVATALLCALSCWAGVPAAGAQPAVAAWPTASYTTAEHSWYPGPPEGARAAEVMAAALREIAPVAAPGSEGAAATGARLLATAERFIGTRYRWGGQSRASGFDCSGFVGRVFGEHGIELPRTARAMASAGTALPASWELLRPGDIVLFAGRGSRISHVAIYAGSRRIIHATSSGGRVRYDDLDSPRGGWYRRRLVAARRLVPGASATGELDLLDPRAPSALRVEEVGGADQGRGKKGEGRRKRGGRWKRLL